MSNFNPGIIASDIVTEVESLLGTPNISGSRYLPWISHATQKTFMALVSAGQDVKERLFGSYTSFNLSGGVAEYNLNTYAAQFGSVIKIEIKYGASGDDWVVARRLPSLANWKNQNNVSTSYQPKESALYYLIESTLGIIPTPPATDSGTPQLKLWYIRRLPQITSVNDGIDIPYRFQYPIVSYVQAMAVMAENEDYSEARNVEARFERDLEKIAQTAADEQSEWDDTNSIVVSADSALFDDPIRY